MATRRVGVITISAVVMGLLPFGAVSAQAANLGIISINCDFGAIAGATIVATGGVGDTFVIDNTGTTDNCVITATDLLTGEDVDHDGGGPGGAGVVTPIANSLAITIVNSGTFTISSSGTGTPARSFVIDACSLAGAGVAASPWLVANLADFRIVGSNDVVAGYNNSCSPSGHYLQTANITGVDTDVSATRVRDVVFTGTYDGDHYNIAFDSSANNGDFEGRKPLFQTLGVGGVIRKLSLSGNIRNDDTESASLVENLYGGTISEVRSSVLIQVDDDNDAVIGGLVARSGGVDQNGSIIYSSFNGRIEWLESTPGSQQEGPVIGGLVGMAQGTGTTEIRDSYSRSAISFNSRGLNPSTGATHVGAAVFAGGLVGSDGETNILENVNFLTNNRVHNVSEVRIIRSYFAGTFTNTCVGTAAQCNTDSPSHVFTGGLIGVSEDRNDLDDLLVSSFWLSTSATNAVGRIVDGGDQPLDYTASSLRPEAPGLSASVLRTLSTYQSKEDGSISGQPSGTSNLATLASTGTLAEQDYRWAIEGGNVQTFVPSGYGTASNFLTRTLFADTAVSQSYRTKGAGNLSAHGGADAQTVTGYPTLGRVWEICANSNGGFPFLVYEELDCAAPGGDASARNPGGLSDAEFAEFQRSGLTLQEFLDRRLAATGAPAEALGQGLIVAALLSAAGIGLILGRRRLRSGNSR